MEKIVFGETTARKHHKIGKFLPQNCYIEKNVYFRKTSRKKIAKLPKKLKFCDN